MTTAGPKIGGGGGQQFALTLIKRNAPRKTLPPKQLKLEEPPVYKRGEPPSTHEYDSEQRSMNLDVSQQQTNLHDLFGKGPSQPHMRIMEPTDDNMPEHPMVPVTRPTTQENDREKKNFVL